MTTQSALTQNRIDPYSHIEPLPRPPEEERDMEQFDGIYAFPSALRPHFFIFEDAPIRNAFRQR